MRKIAALALVLVAIGSACSQPMTVDEYADAMTLATDGYVVESQTLSYDYQSTTEDGARDIVAAGGSDLEAQVLDLVKSSTAQYLALLGDAMTRYAETLDDLDPPGELAEEHDAFVDSVESVALSLPGTRAAVSEAESLRDVQLALSSSGFADGQLRWTATCSALETAIRDQGRGIDLRCVRPETTP